MSAEGKLRIETRTQHAATDTAAAPRIQSIRQFNVNRAVFLRRREHRQRGRLLAHRDQRMHALGQGQAEEGIRPLNVLARRQIELRAMPGALNRAIGHFTTLHREAQVRAFGRHRMDLAADPRQQDRLPIGWRGVDLRFLHFIRCSYLEFFHLRLLMPIN